MIKYINDWKGKFEINGTVYDSLAAITSIPEGATIKLLTNHVAKPVDTVSDDTEWVITVRPYMTKKASPEFDFMAKWNKDIPMPFRTMIGTKVKETNGMVYMKLHCDILYRKHFSCMCCGRPLTNPVSQYFGVGPECGGHNYVNPFDSDEELKETVEAYRKVLLNQTWEGWIIKSAITEAYIYDESMREEDEE